MKSLQNIIPTHIVEAIGGSLMHSLWQIAALALLLIVALAIVPQRAAKIRYWFAIGTMALMLAIPFATFGFLYEAPAQIASSNAENVNFAAFTAPIHVTKTQAAPIGLSEQVSNFFTQNAHILLGIWLIGVFALTLRFLGSCWQVRRLRKVDVEDVSQDLAARFIQLLNKVGIKRQVNLRFSKLVDTPMVLGAMKPVILLPMGLLSGLSMEQVECILIHELGHVRRWDYLVNILQSIAEIILFYHPATWWITRTIRQERENCCDELVVELKENKVQYARALLNLEVMRTQPKLAVASQGGDLMSRIQRITGAVVPKKRRFHARGLLFGLITFLCIATLATQSHTVIKAAMPFLMADSPKALEDLPPLPPQKKVQTVEKNVETTLDANAGLFGVSASWMQDVMQHVKVVELAQDTPTTKVVMNDNGDEIELYFRPGGEVIKGTRNGKPIPQNELAQYGSQAQTFFQGLPPPPPPAPTMRGSNGKLPVMPPMPPMPAVDGMPPMPPMPEMGKMPPMPPMPEMKKNGNKEAYKKDMKRYEKEMERWGEKFGKQFESQDWEKYGEKMEAWGENFGKQFESQDWESYGKDMEKWGEKFAESFEGQNWEEFADGIERWAESFAGGDNLKDSPKHKELLIEIDRLHSELENAPNEKSRKKIEIEIEERHEEMEELHEDQMEEFGERMEEFGEHMEEWAEGLADRIEHDVEVIVEDNEELHRRLEEEERAAHEAEEIGRGTEILTNALLDDGLIKNPEAYKIKINQKELRVDGKKQSKELHRKYLGLLRDSLDIEVGEEVIISHNKK